MAKPPANPLVSIEELMMPHSDKFNALLPSALGVCLLLASAAGQAQRTDSQKDGNIKNPKECVQTEIVWAEERDSDANSLISDYFFRYPEGIKVTNRCNKNVSAAFGVDATLEGIVEDITSRGGRITNVDTTSEEVLRCEPFSTLSFNRKTDFAEFPESVRDIAETYHYERARHLANVSRTGLPPEIWDNLRWKLRWRGCIAWSDEAMKIGTGYRQRCGLAPCPGDAVVADYNVEGEDILDGEEFLKSQYREKLGKAGKPVDAEVNVTDYAQEIEAGESTDQPPAKCYDWVVLGEFNIGKWINGNGRETSALPVGGDTILYDRDELKTHYNDYHGNCETAAESALENAINAMILIGRHTEDIEDERRRIRAFYQGNLDTCQAHFKKLWDKYEGKFCERGQDSESDIIENCYTCYGRCNSLGDWYNDDDREAIIACRIGCDALSLPC